MNKEERMLHLIAVITVCRDEMEELQQICLLFKK
jgi:hypothetical protein